MEEFTRLSLLIFDSIFAHRYKDFNSSIRANCTRRLGMWILGDPVTMYEDTYVKYLGWMCSDRSSAVRLESIKAISKLCDNATSVSLLESFLDRFVGRILEIAAADIDEDVALASISCLRKVQRFGALDEVEADTIGQVDAVVFEQSCSVEVRAEALLFMMEHTEGFEFLLTSTQNRMTPETATKRKKIGKKDTTPESIATLESRRNILLALETLTEFMDEFYQHGTAPQSDAEIDQGRLNGMADMLVKAFEALPKPMSSECLKLTVYIFQF